MKREPTYLEDERGSFFGWYHHADAIPARDLVAVICGPVGHEYTRAHRTLRHLADELAQRGIPALRFDYHGIGDSPGSDLDPDRLGVWQSNVRTAMRRACELSGRSRVCLIGVRLGATLAAMVTEETPSDLLVLWNPCDKGGAYLRELRAIAMTAERAATDIDGALESAGFVMSAETCEAVRDINLLERDIQAGAVLLVGRDDAATDPLLCSHLGARGVPCDFVRAPGWAGMMAEHQFTVVPEKALRTITDWIADKSFPSPLGEGRGEGRKKDQIAVPWNDSTIEEIACPFGGGNHLFGILSRTASDSDRPAIVFFNAGAVHHVGPNRVYVTLARHLSAAGFACFRFDLEGIGDSVLRGPGRENHPYPETATRDAREAIDLLRKRFGYRRFIALGLCSGAHTSFHAGLQLDEDHIAELILINPLTFYWEEGMSLETTRRFEDAAAYKRSMRDPGRWLKLLRGDVNMKRLAEVLVTQARAKLAVKEDERLSRDLRKLAAMNRPVTFFIAEGDPGREILLAGAPRTAKRAMRSGKMRVEMIPGADHTFSQFKPRADLLNRLGAHLSRHTQL
jgi:alpha-beta hydrolase superfamily lysophospholipase